MKKNLYIKLKAAFLLVVFSVNTIVGFACAIGIDMGFNSSHHHEEKELTVHQSPKHNKIETGNDKSNEDNDNCCHNKVANIAQSDKSLPQYYSGINPFFFTLFVSFFYNINSLTTSQVVINIRYFYRSYHPPISDIRIAIQSFQI
jgi:hypothetical protein